MEDVDGDIKHLSGEEDIDPRCVETNFVPLPHLICQREIGHRLCHMTSQHLERWGEESFIHRQHSHLACQIPTTSKTTYLLAFSPDGTKVASSHGDHNIYVTDMKTGKCICTLKGHLRSPWCVAFHPSSNEIIASGCLGGEVRVWDLKGGSEVWTPNKKCESAIASLAFHPTDQVLVIATENDLYFWDWFCPQPFAKISTASKLERVKFVEFDPLGSKLITGIAVIQPDRNQLDSGLHNTINNNNNNTTTTNGNNNNDNSGSSTHPEYSWRSNYSTPPQLYRCYMESRMQRIHRYSHNQHSTSGGINQEANNQGEAPTNLSWRRSSQGHHRNSATSVSADRVEHSRNEDIGSAMAPGPSSVPDLPSSDQSSAATPVFRRRYPLSRPSNSPGVEDDHRPGPPGATGDFRPGIRPPVSDDSASSSSSSMDSSSSLTSATSGGAATHLERNTRLSLLWTSRLHRAGPGGPVGGGSPSPPGGVYYDLEERRGEGSVMRGNGPPGPGGREEGRDPPHLGDGGGSLRPEEEGDDSDPPGERGRPTPRGWRHSVGQGGRWMYYRSKFPTHGAGPPPRSGGGPVRTTVGSPGPSRARSLNRCSAPPVREWRPQRRPPEDDASLAVPGPSGLSRRAGAAAGASSNPSSSADPFPPLLPSWSSFSRATPTRPRQSLLDPHSGVQLLSRFIKDMQNICRWLSVPRAQLEITRRRSEITRLHQIRSMLYDIQDQIQSLRASVDQTISEEFPPGVDESLNSASVNPEPLGTELLNGSDQGLTDQVELEVNIGTEDIDQFSYSTLAEEDPEQLAGSSGGLLSFNPLDLSSLPPSDNVPSTLEPIPENESSTRRSSSLMTAYKHSRTASRALRSLAASRVRNRRNWRNRLAWTGLLRRLPLQRRGGLRSRAHSTSSLASATGGSANAGETSRSLRRRDVREARGEKSRTGLLHRGIERRLHSSFEDGVPSSSTMGGSASGGNQLPDEPSSQVRRRHLGDWQRRLRSTLALQQERQREQDSPGSGAHPPPSSSSFRNNSSDREIPSRGVDAVPSSSRAALARAPSSSQPSAVIDPSTLRTPYPMTAAVDEDGNDTDDTGEEQPERVTRAGPPTTSLSSRIAAMQAEQREARHRLMMHRPDPGPGPSSGPGRPIGGARPRLRAAGLSRLRVELQRRLGRNYIHEGPFPPLPPSSAIDDHLLANNDYPGVPPPCPSIRSFRGDILSRNRLLRHLDTSGRSRALRQLVSGGDLAGATLAAINSTSPDDDRQRDLSASWQERDSYRHILQVTADGLNQLMHHSLSGSLNTPNPREAVGGSPFDPEDEVEGESVATGHLPFNSRPSRRRSHLPGWLNPIRSFGGGSSNSSNSFPNDDFQALPSFTAASSSINRHINNLRLLVWLALHLIYQLLNFICNQNLSHEERPISRLHNPFREGGGGESNVPHPSQSSSAIPRTTTVPTRGSTPSAPPPSNSSPSPPRTTSEDPSLRRGQRSFEVDPESGLHNLRALLETIRLASEELRQDAEQVPPVPPSPRGRRSGVSPQPGPATPHRADGTASGSTVRRLTDFLIRTGSGSLTPRDSQVEAEDGPPSNPRIQRPLPTTPAPAPLPVAPPRSDPHAGPLLPIPQIVLSDMSRDGDFAPSRSLTSSPPGDMDLRTFGGIPLRFLGRQNAVDRRTPSDSDGEESNGGPSHENRDPTARREAEAEGGEARSFSWYSAPGEGSTGTSTTPRPPHHQRPFRLWNNPDAPYNLGVRLNTPFGLINPLEREEPEQLMYFTQPYFNQYVAASRNMPGTLFDHYSPIYYNGTNRFYRIQAWDFRNFEIPNISDSFSNVVVPRCRIHFDASVSISVDGTLLAAVLPDPQSLTRIGVYSLEAKTLGQLLFSRDIGFNIVCVSFSPTMRHLVVGISSHHRLGVHYSERHVIGHIYKLCHEPSPLRGVYPGTMSFCRSIELQSGLRQSSLNCIRWVPIPGQGLVYGTNRGQLTIIR